MADCRIILVFGFVCLFFKPSYGWLVFCVCFLTLRDAVINVLILTYRKYSCPDMQVLMNSTFSSEHSLCTSREHLANHCSKQPGLAESKALAVSRRMSYWQSFHYSEASSLWILEDGYTKKVFSSQSSSAVLFLCCVMLVSVQMKLNKKWVCLWALTVLASSCAFCWLQF